MTLEKAIRVLEFDLDHKHNDESKEAMRMAIQALKEQAEVEEKTAWVKDALENGWFDDTKSISEELNFVQPHKKVSVNLDLKPCEDAVSREDALMCLTGEWTELTDELIHRFIRRIKALPPVNPQEPKWIPVSERLPEWDIECLVVDADGDFGIGYYREDAKAWDSPNWGWLERKDRVDNKEAFTEPCGIGKVIAWMPLPEPYKERSNKK